MGDVKRETTRKMYKKILSLLSARERKQAGILMTMILTMAILDTMGVASILPFIAVLANPEIVQSNTILNEAFVAGRIIGIQTIDHFLFFLGLLAFVLLVVSLIIKALTAYAQTRFGLMREYSIGRRLVEAYLHQPYSWFLSRNSAELGKTVLSEVAVVVNGVMLPLMTVIAQSAVALALLFMLVLVEPMLALSACTVLGLTYVIVFAIASRSLKLLGQSRIKANQERFTAVSEAFGGAKEVKVGRLEEIYVQRFAKPAEIFARDQSAAQIIAILPRYALEAIAFGGMLLVLLYLMKKDGGFDSALPIITVYAFAGYRLMPALQQIYGALTQLRFAREALDALEQDLSNLQSKLTPRELPDAIPMTRSITLNQVSYSYPDSPQPALQGIDLSIPVRSVVGLVGTTGSGKTTTVDVILGLLEPTMGSLRVDGKPITAENRSQWQRSIGYVPQYIYLADANVAANIAFGVNAENIDCQALERAAKLADLHEFVINGLPDGYNTMVGERGVRLSGGQRQRIGIARALYHNPEVLIMDEATSALDNITEQAVMSAVNSLSKKITIILVAHRLSTVRRCDKIYLMEGGRVEAYGTYEGLLSSSDRFRKIALEHRGLT